MSFAIVHLQSGHFPARLACGVVAAEPPVPTAAVSAPKVADFDRSADERSWIPYPTCTRDKADNSMESGNDFGELLRR